MEYTNKIFQYDHDVTKRELSLPVADVCQLCELSIMRGTEVGEHIQPCDEITYAISGKAIMYSDDAWEEISAGQIHYIQKGVKHRIVADSDKNFRYMCIGYMPRATNEETKHIAERLSQIPHFVASDNGNVRVLTEMLINESYVESADSKLMINAYMTQILVEVSRIAQGFKGGRGGKYHNTQSNLAIYNTIRFVERNFLEIESVKDVAKALSYSEYYLSHLFKEKVGISIKSYILNEKIKLAKKLLAEPERTVGEISEMLGYETSHAFSQTFKKKVGISPNEYRKAKK